MCHLEDALCATVHTFLHPVWVKGECVIAGLQPRACVGQGSGALGRMRSLWRGCGATLAKDIPFAAMCALHSAYTLVPQEIYFAPSAQGTCGSSNTVL